MTDEQLEEYRRELNTPYSDDELGFHLTDRDAKSLLELTHAHNFMLIRLTKRWIAYVNGKGPRPERNIWKFLTPGNNKENSACDRLNQLVEFYTQFAYGQAPVLPIAFFCSRSTLTLIQNLEELYCTTHLDTAERAAKDFFTVITNESPRSYTGRQLKTLLEKCVADFVSACEANAKELHAFLLDFLRGHKPSKPATKDDVAQIVSNECAAIRTKQDASIATLADVRKTVVRMDDREKKAQHRKKSLYTLDQLNAIHTLWLTAQKNPGVKSMSTHKSDYGAALQYYKKEFNALGILTADELKRALKAWSQRASRKRE